MISRWGSAHAEALEAWGRVSNGPLCLARWDDFVGEPGQPVEELLHTLCPRGVDDDGGRASLFELTDRFDERLAFVRLLRFAELAVRVVLDLERRQGHDDLERAWVVAQARLIAQVRHAS